MAVLDPLKIIITNFVSESVSSEVDKASVVMLF